jgi:predicted nucleic acid-binding Zn ribbon protein
MRKQFSQRTTSYPKELNSILETSIRSLGLSHGIAQGKVLNEWNTIVGEHIANVTKPERFDKDTLIISVTSSAWRNELLFYKENILKKIATLVGDGIVKDLRFR